MPRGLNVVNASDQSNSIRNVENPGDLKVNTSANPALTSAFSSANSFEAGIANQTNEEIQRELARARDQISTGMQAEGEGAVARGADPSLFKTRALAQGKRDLHALQGQLAGVALDKHGQAIGLKTGAATSLADDQRQMHLGTMAAQLGQDRLALDQASEQARLDDMPMQRFLDMAKTFGTGALGSWGSGGFSGSGVAKGGGSSVWR